MRIGEINEAASTRYQNCQSSNSKLRATQFNRQLNTRTEEILSTRQLDTLPTSFDNNCCKGAGHFVVTLNRIVPVQ